jgi:hypothetical protein
MTSWAGVSRRMMFGDMGEYVAWPTCQLLSRRTEAWSWNLQLAHAI